MSEPELRYTVTVPIVCTKCSEKVEFKFGFPEPGWRVSPYESITRAVSDTCPKHVFSPVIETDPSRKVLGVAAIWAPKETSAEAKAGT